VFPSLFRFTVTWAKLRCPIKSTTSASPRPIRLPFLSQQSTWTAPSPAGRPDTSSESVKGLVAEADAVGAVNPFTTVVLPAIAMLTVAPATSLARACTWRGHVSERCSEGA
jgi:hypothetical protein